MKPEFIKCEFCRTEVSSGPCKLSAYHATIDGKEYVFCCAQCAQRYKQKKQKTKK